MIFASVATTRSQAAAEAWGRCDAAAALAVLCPGTAAEVARFIDAHFPLILYALSVREGPVPYHLYPERQQALADTMLDKWGNDVYSSLSDVRTSNLSAVSRLLQKASPHVGSVRYIGAQLERACADSHTMPEQQLLRDILRSCALGTWSKRPLWSPKSRFEIWRETPSEQYTRIGFHLRSSDVQTCIAKFAHGIASMRPGSYYMLRRRRPYPTVITLLALQRAAGAGPAAWPRHGFTIAGDPRGKLMSALRPDNPGAAPSAKRVKAAFAKHATAADAIAVRGLAHKATLLAAMPLEAAERAAQMRLAPVYALLCTECGTWKTRPRGSKRSGPAAAAGVLVDLNNSTVLCSDCKSHSVYRVLLNGYQVRNGLVWGRLCTSCGDFNCDLKCHGTSMVCARCLAVDTLPGPGHCACGLPGNVLSLAKASGRFVVKRSCPQHAAE